MNAIHGSIMAVESLVFDLMLLAQQTQSRIRASYFLSAFAAITLGVIIYAITSYDKRRKYLPPGPKGLPFLGNLAALKNEDKIPDTLRQWAKDYGPIVYTKMGGQDWIWLNSPAAVKELMDKRGSKYSSRPRMPMAFEATSGRKRQIFMPYGESWRSLRKVSHAALNMASSNSYKPVQDFESKQVMYEFLHAKDEMAFYDINRRYSASVIMTVSYGHRVKDWGDPVLKDIYQVLEHFTLMSAPGAWLVDAFPSLAALPSWMVQNWWKTGRAWFQHDSAVYLKLYRNLVDQVKAGTAPDCFVKDLYLAEPEKHGIDEVGAAYAAGTLVEAGSESTSTVINAWLLACLLYPDAVQAAQEELDRVVGAERMPEFGDEPNLPYIRAMVKETLRWWPITKVGANHATTEDDWYEGYFIPKGSVVMLNWWAIHYDSTRWANAEDFDPSRYLDDEYSTAEALNCPNPEDRDHYTYGAGRRVCAGLHVAQNSLFINMARTLWAFNVRHATGADGRPVHVVARTEPGFLMVPCKFPAVLEARSSRHAEIVEKQWLEAQEGGLNDYARVKKRL